MEKKIIENPNPPRYQPIYFQLQTQDEYKIQETIGDLVTEGILNTRDSDNDLGSWVSLTENGKAAIKAVFTPFG